MSLYPLLVITPAPLTHGCVLLTSGPQMEKFLVAPVVAEYLALANRNAGEYAKLAAGLYELVSDSAVNPTLRQRYSHTSCSCEAGVGPVSDQTNARLVRRAYNTITWPAGQEPFETVVKARAILAGQS